MVIESDKAQFVTVVDAVAVMQGQSTPKHRVPLREGLNRVEVPVVSDDGTVAATVDTGPRIKGVVLEHNPPLISGPFTQSDVQLAAVAGACSVAIVSIIVVFRTISGRSESPERLSGPR
ncbi:hypothetical protein [Haloprofundus salilacus]|uniref:hypothetical protein n=1 Tax=Haloprofundus salilacus TaxID=2876190 RepID=UPI001CCC721A|nr:hypothetical protein [Haloprofundus salilacus]